MYSAYQSKTSYLAKPSSYDFNWEANSIESKVENQCEKRINLARQSYTGWKEHLKKKKVKKV